MDDKTARQLLERPELRFHKEPEAAGSYLLALSNALLEGGELPPASRLALGQALREAALLAVDTDTQADKKAAGEALLKALGLLKGGGQKNLEQAARAGATNKEIADRHNIGKNEVPRKLSLVSASERELLDRRLSHTVGVLLRVVEEMGPVAGGPEVSEQLRKYLAPQFRMLSNDDIEMHVNDAMRLAKAEGLIESIGRDIKRTF